MADKKLAPKRIIMESGPRSSNHCLESGRVSCRLNSKSTVSDHDSYNNTGTTISSSQSVGVVVVSDDDDDHNNDGCNHNNNKNKSSDNDCSSNNYDDGRGLLLESAKVSILNPRASRTRRTEEKLQKFCVEKLHQSTRRCLQNSTSSLYGREEEIQLLQQELETVCSGSAPDGNNNNNNNNNHHNHQRSLVMIAGQSGEGKTALALTLQEPAIKRGAFFVKGKFDLAALGEPYSGVRAAIQQLCGELFKLPRRHNRTGTSTLEDLQDLAAKQLDGWEFELLCSVIPELEVLTQQQESHHHQQQQEKPPRSSIRSSIRASMRKLLCSARTEESAGNDDNINDGGADEFAHVKMRNSYTGTLKANDRLQFALKKLINIISGYRPLIFVCDDAQFADPMSLSLLQGWILDEKNKSLMVIWTYRSNMVDQDHFVSQAIRDMEDQRDKLHFRMLKITTRPLTQEHVHSMVTDILNLQEGPTQQHIQALSSLIHRKTLGNVFFVLQYLLSLANRGLLTFSMSQMIWEWDIHMIQTSSTATANVIDFMKQQLVSDPVARQLLPLAACLGSTFNTRELEEIIVSLQDPENVEAREMFDKVLGLDQIDPRNVSHQLADLETRGLIEAASTTGSNIYSFVHDKALEGALAIIPSASLGDVKFYMGSILLQRMESVKIHGASRELTFLIVNLLDGNLDRAHPDQRNDLLELHVLAGDTAYQSAAFERSATYYQSAIELLPNNHWQAMYKESHELYLAAAESEMAVGSYDKMREHAAVVLNLDCPILDKIPMHKLILDAHFDCGEGVQAFDKSILVLSRLGFKLPTKMIAARTKAALTSIKLNRKKWSPEAIKKLQVSSDPKDEAISKLHDSFIMLTEGTTPEAWTLCIILCCKHIMDRGLTRYSAVPLAWFALVIQNEFVDFHWAKEHAEVTWGLLQRLPNRNIESRVSMVLNIFTLHWTSPIQNSIQPLTQGYKRGMETGDFLSAFWNAHFIQESAVWAGTDLASLEQDVEAYAKQEVSYGMIKHEACMNSVWQLVLNLRGKSSNTSVLTGSVHDEAAVLKLRETTPDFHHLAHVQKDRLFAAAIFGDFERAADIGLESNEMIAQAICGQHSTIISRFVTGLACFEMARRTTTSARKKKVYIQEAKKNHKIIQQWLKQGNPNAHHFAVFLDAENAARKGNDEKAIKHYQQTIILAGRTGYIHDHALGCERLSALFRRVGDKTNAKHVLQDAIDLYREWGALAKVELLEEKMKQLYPEQRPGTCLIRQA